MCSKRAKCVDAFKKFVKPIILKLMKDLICVINGGLISLQAINTKLSKSAWYMSCCFRKIQAWYVPYSQG